MGTMALSLLSREGPHTGPTLPGRAPAASASSPSRRPCCRLLAVGRASPRSALSGLRESTVAAPRGLSTPLPAPQGAQQSWELNSPTAPSASLANIGRGPAWSQMLGQPQQQTAASHRGLNVMQGNPSGSLRTFPAPTEALCTPGS